MKLSESLNLWGGNVKVQSGNGRERELLRGSGDVGVDGDAELEWLQQFNLEIPGNWYKF